MGPESICLLQPQAASSIYLSGLCKYFDSKEFGLLVRFATGDADFERVGVGDSVATLAQLLVLCLVYSIWSINIC